MRKIAAIATLSVLTAVGAVAVASTANAHSGATGNATTVSITKATKSYNAPTTQAMPVAVFQPSDVVNVACYTEGHQADGSSIWLKLATEGGQREYVNRASVDVSGTDLPRC